MGSLAWRGADRCAEQGVSTKSTGALEDAPTTQRASFSAGVRSFLKSRCISGLKPEASSALTKPPEQ